MEDLKITMVKQSKKINPITKKRDKKRIVISDHEKKISFKTVIKKGNEEMNNFNSNIKKEEEFVFETKIFRKTENGIHTTVSRYDEPVIIARREENPFVTKIHGLHHEEPEADQFNEMVLPEDEDIKEELESINEELSKEPYEEYKEAEYQEEEFELDTNVTEPDEEPDLDEDEEFMSDPEESDLEEDENFEDEDDYDEEELEEYSSSDDYYMDLVPENKKRRIRDSMDKVTKKNLLDEQF